MRATLFAALVDMDREPNTMLQTYDLNPPDRQRMRVQHERRHGNARYISGVHFLYRPILEDYIVREMHPSIFSFLRVNGLVESSRLARCRVTTYGRG